MKHEGMAVLRTRKAAAERASNEAVQVAKDYTRKSERIYALWIAGAFLFGIAPYIELVVVSLLILVAVSVTDSVLTRTWLRRKEVEMRETLHELFSEVAAVDTVTDEIRAQMEEEAAHQDVRRVFPQNYRYMKPPEDQS